ncbi:MAG: tRNA pseudouridine(55) synthase TruB [Solirubrobacteraceae bacterium]
MTDGILLIDKPVGITSHDVVARVRRSLGGAKTGHSGTLDPFASGLLIVLVGKATRQQRRMMELPKRYETIARLGARSSTGDTEGEITETGLLPPDPPELPSGEIRQRPPIYSAVKIGGERAYRKARRGERFEMPERIVTVSRFEQLWRTPEGTTHDGEQAPPGAHPEGHRLPGAGKQAGEPPTQTSAPVRAAYLIECSSGTYVRSLIADLGDAYCEELRRTAIGPFDVNDAVPPPAPNTPWENPPLLSIEAAIATAERFEAESRRRPRASKPPVT